MLMDPLPPLPMEHHIGGGGGGGGGHHVIVSHHDLNGVQPVGHHESLQSLDLDQEREVCVEFAVLEKRHSNERRSSFVNAVHFLL